jgi:diguanylate cyclase (GGDEF)-like protein/PAS domain S-box-containing protein
MATVYRQGKLQCAAPTGIAIPAGRSKNADKRVILNGISSETGHESGMADQQAQPAKQQASRGTRRETQKGPEGTGPSGAGVRHAPQGAAGSRTASIAETEHVFSLIGPDFFYSSFVFAGAAVITALLTGSLPGVGAGALMALAIAIMACSRLVLPFERAANRMLAKQLSILYLVVGLPLFLYSLGLSIWTQGASLTAMLIAAGTCLVATVVAIAALHGRLPGMAVAIAGIVAGGSAIPAPLTSVAVFGVSLVGGVVLSSRYMRRVREAEQARKVEQRRQKRAESLLSEFEENGLGWFWETDRRGNVTYVSPRIASLLGASSRGLVGRPFTSLFQLDEDADRESGRTLQFHLSTRSSFSELEVVAATHEEEERWWSITGRPVLDNFNNFQGFRGSGTDLTERKRTADSVTQLARFDSLTKLANRFQMAEWLEKILNALQEDRRACAVFLLDLDRFKQVNDTMGHPAGDALLKQVADRLRSTVKGSGNVGRLGGDEFQVILPGHHKKDDLAQLAHRIIETLSQPYSIEGSRVTIGASLGISQCPENGTSSEELIRNADLALYAAKDGGRGRYHFYADDLHSDANERRQLEQDLRDAMVSGDLELHYQPVVSTTTEKITGFEALLRWKHPQHGYLSPARFIPVAEESGLVTQIGEWALRAACAQLAQWPESVRIAVNVSPLQFASPSLPAIITSAIASAQVDPARLELEITEGVFLNDDSATDAMFSTLKSIGVRLALDDFGTGYSSLGYLKKAPFDKIKIDQSFVRGATLQGSRNGAIISAIVSLAEALNMETTAEGVETLDELDLIRSLGCSHIQGFIYEQALTAPAASELLATGLRVIASGPQSARAPRQTMLRKVELTHGPHSYQGTIRNISASGAMIEGLWDVPKDTVFELHFARDYAVKVTSRWSREDRMGVEFERPLPIDSDGRVIIAPPRRSVDAGDRSILRKAG